MSVPGGIPLIDLRGPNHVSIPALGFGVWQIPDDEVEAAVGTALETGYRHIDTARLYENEEGVGRALVKAGMPGGSGAGERSVFVTTKLWNDDHRGVGSAFEASSTRLGLQTLDLFLIHWPAPRGLAYVDAWRDLLALRAEGRVREVGVCNFHIPHLEQLHEATGEFPAINQIELHPYLQQQALRAFHAEHAIVTESWSPLARGGAVLRDPVVAEVAAKHGVSPAQAIIRWHLDLGNVVIPRSVTPSRIRENFDVMGFRLDEQDHAAFAALDRGMRTGPDPDRFKQGAPL
ncbi:MAG: aldo/keto reductase [Dermatophilaceae bacterium]